MKCDSHNCDAAGKLCDALGIQFVADIEIQESKETLESRINQNQRIKDQQMEFCSETESL